MSETKLGQDYYYGWNVEDVKINTTTELACANPELGWTKTV